MTDPFSVTSSALPAGVRVLSFRGTEAISALYSFEMHLVVEDPTFDPAAAIGADATFAISGEDEPRAFHGVLSTLEIVNDLPHSAVIRAVLAPRLWRLTLTRHSRVFVKQSLPAILDAVLQGAGLTGADYALELTGTYGPLEHVCQYRESKLAFLSRRMEREGVYFFFEQGDTREKLIVADDRSCHERLSKDPVRYYQATGAGVGGGEGLHAFRAVHSSIPGSVQVHDYDYLRPTLDLTGSAPVSDGSSEEVHLRGENVSSPEDGARIARIRAEELKARKVVFRGGGRGCLLRAGYTFALEDHPRPNVDGDYLATEVEHRGGSSQGDARALLGHDAEEGYHVDVVAIPASTQFRPGQRTPVPRIYGMEGAVVDGEADHDYAQLDEHGRYLVKMRFDESTAKNGKASARVRMMQPHGGSPESFHFPLRKGTEVLLAFEGGDPDRPVIAGVVPNAVTPSPVAAANSTKNILQTGGKNRLVMEDTEGKEYIHLATPHKGTYIHLGSPFNPQYNKITNTAGTSLSYTESISTSVTGVDAQTVVEDARLTIIGRSRIQGSDAQGTEIALLAGPDFVTRFEEGPLDKLYNDLAQLVNTDAPAASTALKNANKFLGTTPIDAGQASVYVYQVQATVDLMVQDISTILGDAQAVVAAGGKNAASGQKVLSDLNGTQNPAQPTVTNLQKDAATAVGYLVKGDAPSLTSLAALIKSDAGLLGVPASGSGATAVAATGLFVTSALPALLADVEPPSSTPIAPSPSITASFLNLQHSASSNDTGLFLDTADPTAMDLPSELVLPSNLPGLHPGSDIKIVGGDYVSQFAYDQRSQVGGTSYGLVLGGQASVVKKGQRSKVLAPSHSAPLDPTLAPPTTFTPLSYPDPLGGLPDGNTAQTSEVYGNQFSWVNGTVTSTITHGTHAEVFAPVQAPPPSNTSTSPVAAKPVPSGHTEPTTAQSTALHGDQYAWVDGTVNSTVNKGSHAEIFAPTPASNSGHHLNTASTTAQSTTLHGDQFSWIDGDKTTNVTGNVSSTINGSQTTHVDSQTTFVNNSLKRAYSSEDVTWLFKFAMCLGPSISIQGLAASLTVLKLSFTLFSLHNTPISIKNGTAKVETHGISIFE